ncbi:MAG: hypothetical protein ACW98K_00110 [Candidatus Kariarchaeaceae archaeon]|jgi:hypothetical protein
MKLSQELKSEPLWITHLATIKGGINYLRKKISNAWLFGSTGYAFFINIREDLCPSGPTAFDIYDMQKRTKSIGINLDNYVYSEKTKPDFSEKQKQAFELVKEKIENDIPLIGWELGIPEFFNIHGIEEETYLFSVYWDNHKEDKKNWQQLANTEIGWLHVGSVESSDDTINDFKAVKDALDFATKVATDPKNNPAQLPNEMDTYFRGSEAYNVWINSLQEKKELGWGTAYNVACWHECRFFAEDFLREAGYRLPEKYKYLLNEAANYYKKVHKALAKVMKIYPFKGPEQNPDVSEPQRKKAITHLREAKIAEESGIKMLQLILEEMT